MSALWLRTAVAVLLSGLAVVRAHGQGLPPEQRLDSAVTALMEAWRLPGLVVVAVRGGQPAIIRGYGTRVAGQSRTVDPRTQVQIASHTKAITATALAMLVDEGRLSWDDPVKKHIPDFAVPDPLVAEQVTIRDLVSHRAGLAAPAIGGFRNPNHNVTDLLASLRTRGTTPLRSRQVYSQPAMALAGEVVARVSGISWERFVRDRIFTPLRMTDSYTSTPDLEARFGTPSADLNIMIPARSREGRVVVGDWSEIGTNRLYAPAGGVTSTGSDMAKWIEFLLNAGEYEGTSLLSEEALAETRIPLIPLDPALREFTDPIGPLGVGTLGWNAVAYGRRTVYFAPGGWMSSVIAILPNDGVGVGIFTNAFFAERHGFESLFPTYAMAMTVIDLILGESGQDWSAAYEAALANVAR